MSEQPGERLFGEGGAGSRPGPDVPGEQGEQGGHGWMMLACCVPMLVIVGALVVTGVSGTGLVLFALACVALMAAMMAGKGHGKGG